MMEADLMETKRLKQSYLLKFGYENPMKNNETLQVSSPNYTVLGWISRMLPFEQKRESKQCNVNMINKLLGCVQQPELTMLRQFLDPTSLVNLRVVLAKKLERLWPWPYRVCEHHYQMPESWNTSHFVGGLHCCKGTYTLKCGWCIMTKWQEKQKREIKRQTLNYNRMEHFFND